MAIKIHRPLAEAVIGALDDVFNQGYYADKVIERKLKSNKKWGARDRRFIAEAVYDIVRWWRKILFSVGREWKENPGEPANYSDALMWNVLAGWLTARQQELPDWEEFKRFRPDIFEKRWQKSQRSRAVRESIPDWVDQLGDEQLGELWPQFIQELNKTAPIFLRANRLKTTPENLVQSLADEEVPAELVSGFEDAVKLSIRKNVFATKSFRAGLFEVQDAGSQKIAPFTLAKPGQRVVDACAGAGGKSLHLAALMNNRGKIISMDIHEWKLKELRKRASRAGIDIIEVRPIENTKVIKRLYGRADVVLLDVPCTGMGVLRRNPDSKWKLTPQRYIEIKNLQRDLLRDYSKMTQVGGVLVYATCSILPSENSDQIKFFLSQNENQWEVEEEITISPGEHGSDGFYAARLRRFQ